jgi:hypothetical protein
MWHGWLGCWIPTPQYHASVDPHPWGSQTTNHEIEQEKRRNGGMPKFIIPVIAMFADKRKLIPSLLFSVPPFLLFNSLWVSGSWSMGIERVHRERETAKWLPCPNPSPVSPQIPGQPKSAVRFLHLVVIGAEPRGDPARCTTSQG